MKQGIYHAGNRIVFLYILSILVVFSLASAIPIIHDITVADNPSYEGEEILFSANVSSNSSNNSLLNSTWDFGDGEHAFTILAFHAYADNGVYTASLMVCDIEGCDTADVNVTVLNRNPIVLFLNESYYCDEGGNVLLAPNITDVPADTLTYQWSTGENTSSIIYSCGNGDDIVQVSLTVEDDDGGEGDASTDVLISNVAPTADPHGPYKTAAGHEVCFMGSASDPYDTEFEFMWDFDYDGDFDTDGEGENPCTTYTTSGTYTLGLIVDDGEGEGESESEIATTTVVVYDYGIPLSLGENLFSIPLVPYRPQGFVDTRIDFVLGGDVVQNADIIWEFRWDNTLQRNVWRYNEPNATKTGWNTHPERIQRIHPGYGYIMLMDNDRW